MSTEFKVFADHTTVIALALIVAAGADRRTALILRGGRRLLPPSLRHC